MPRRRAPPHHACLRAALLAAVLAAPGAATAQAPGAGPSPPSVPAAVVGAFDALFSGPYAGRRAVHAFGPLVEGRFTPAPGASQLSRAPHLGGPEIPVLVRFSNFAAVPGLPDGHPDASPRGMAIKFLLPGGIDTDIVAHSYDGFPAATPEEFLAFLRALPDHAQRAAFAAEHSAARAFLEHPKPAPESYATEAFFGVSALHFTNAAGVLRHGRYRITPLADLSHLTPEQAAARPPAYLPTELKSRLGQGPVLFRLAVQLAQEGDPVDDGSQPWPEGRPEVEIGTLALLHAVPEGDERQRDLTFVPTNLVGGIAPSADPMLTARTQSYRISADRRMPAP
ncbi:catalase family peroxidase [Roseomonas sp. WA12]